MLAELAAINAAYGVIKEVVGNGQELYAAGQHLANFFDCKYRLQKKINEKPPSQREQLQEFFALEEIKQKEKELKEMMIMSGRPGLWDDWLVFQAKQARARKEEIAELKRQSLRKKEKIKTVITTTAIILLGCAFFIGIVWLTIFIVSHQDMILSAVS